MAENSTIMSRNKEKNSSLFLMLISLFFKQATGIVGLVSVFIRAWFDFTSSHGYG
jgi:hypothetical protein